MELIGKTNINFLGKRYVCFGLSGILLAMSLWSLSGGINRGIDFAGGTEIQVKFSAAPRVDELRSRLTSLDIGDVSLQSIGAPEDSEFLIRIGTTEEPGQAHAQEREPATPDASPAAEEPAIPDALPTAEEPAIPEALPPDEPPSEPTGEAEGTGPSTAGLEPDAEETPEEPPPGESGSEQSRVYRAVLAVLRELTGSEEANAGKVDLNVAARQEIARLLAARDGGEAQAASLASAIAAYRTDHAGLFTSYDELTQIAEMTPEALEYLRENTYLGTFTIRKVDFVGPRVGRELAEKAYLAMFFALAGMLIYITLRFRKLGFALGGILALVHDGVIAAGVFNFWGGQFDLTIVAALLTLLGYSINDTIVIFDRVRENLRAMRGTGIIQVFNDSINQTLSRTLLTSLTTLIVVLCLYFFGGETIHGFAFVLMFGVLIGTYSTIFIASPVVILHQQWFTARRANARGRTGSPPSSSRSSRSSRRRRRTRS
jgi:preprotein translocase SecF subunit